MREFKIPSAAERVAAELAKQNPRCRIRLKANCSVQGAPGAQPGDTIELDEVEAMPLITDGLAEPVQIRKEVWSPPPPATKRIRLLSPRVVAGHPDARVGDLLTVKSEDADYLIGFGGAVEVPLTTLQKIGALFGI